MNSNIGFYFKSPIQLLEGKGREIFVHSTSLNSFYHAVQIVAADDVAEDKMTTGFKAHVRPWRVNLGI